MNLHVSQPRGVPAEFTTLLEGCVADAVFLKLIVSFMGGSTRYAFSPAIQMALTAQLLPTSGMVWRLPHGLHLPGLHSFRQNTLQLCEGTEVCVQARLIGRRLWPAPVCASLDQCVFASPGELCIGRVAKS